VCGNEVDRGRVGGARVDCGVGGGWVILPCVEEYSILCRIIRFTYILSLGGVILHHYCTHNRITFIEVQQVLYS